MRIAVLWSQLSGYLNSCLKMLVEMQGVELFVSYQSESDDAPFNPKEYDWIRSSYRYSNKAHWGKLEKELERFNPDVLLVGSWHVTAYRYALKRYSGRAIRVLFMDNQWRGTLKQRIGSTISSWHIRPLYEGVFLPGERQAVFAKKLGFHDSNIIRGGYSCNHPAFSTVWEQRQRNVQPCPNSFIFVGRLVTTKGVHTLSRAYRQYRNIHTQPFDLVCCGEGPLRSEMEKIEGVRIFGFVQPEELPRKFLEASCLLLPSTFEPWGVVVHEAAASGMAVICTSVCGAMVHLVQPGYNGYVVEPDNVDDLVLAMVRYTNLTPQERMKMGANSYALSSQYTPKQWASNLLTFVDEFRSERR